MALALGSDNHDIAHLQVDNEINFTRDVDIAYMRVCFAKSLFMLITISYLRRLYPSDSRIFPTINQCLQNLLRNRNVHPEDVPR